MAASLCNFQNSYCYLEIYRLRDGIKLAPGISATLCFLKFVFFCKKLKSFYFFKFVLVFGNLPPPEQQQFGSQNLRCLVFFEPRFFLQKIENFNFSKFELVFGNLPSPGRQQFGSQNLRYLVFFDICKNFEKDEKNRNVKILKDVSLFAASGTAPKVVPRSG